MDESILLRRDLTVPFPGPVWPEGILPVLFSQSMLEELHALLSAGYTRLQGDVPPFEVWQNRLLNDPEYDAELLFVAQAANGALVGFAHCWNSGFLKDIVVHPDWRGLGIGEALVLRAFEACRNRYHKRCELKVKPANIDAVRFYTKLGFEKVPS